MDVLASAAVVASSSTTTPQPSRKRRADADVDIIDILNPVPKPVKVRDYNIELMGSRIKALESKIASMAMQSSMDSLLADLDARLTNHSHAYEEQTISQLTQSMKIMEQRMSTLETEHHQLRAAVVEVLQSASGSTSNHQIDSVGILSELRILKEEFKSGELVRRIEYVERKQSQNDVVLNPLTDWRKRMDEYYATMAEVMAHNVTRTDTWWREMISKCAYAMNYNLNAVAKAGGSDGTFQIELDRPTRDKRGMIEPSMSKGESDKMQKLSNGKKLEYVSKTLHSRLPEVARGKLLKSVAVQFDKLKKLLKNIEAGIKSGATKETMLADKRSAFFANLKELFGSPIGTFEAQLRKMKKVEDNPYKRVVFNAKKSEESESESESESSDEEEEEDSDHEEETTMKIEPCDRPLDTVLEPLPDLNSGNIDLSSEILDLGS